MLKIKIPNLLLFTIIILIGFLIGYVFSHQDFLLPEHIKIIEKPSPYNHIPEKDIIIAQDKVIIKVKEPRWATFEDSGSMEPVFDIGANTIQIIPNSTKDIHIGDIVSYESWYSDDIIIHRVVGIDYDNDGWYVKLKGDNNLIKDPGRVRFNQIKSLTVAIIY